jgi:integrase
MTVGLAIHRGRRDIPELPGGVLRESCRTPPADKRQAVGPSTISTPTVPPSTVPARPIITRVREAISARHYSRRTERAYAGWIYRYLSFHDGHTAEEMGEVEITRFLSTLAARGKVTASTQNQALSALLFLYRDVLGRELHGLDAIRAKPSVRLPVVLSREEVSRVLRHLHGTPWLMMSLMYGAGLRLLECARLRVKDLDFDRGAITVRDGKGRKDRVSVLPAVLAVPLQRPPSHQG